MAKRRLNIPLTFGVHGGDVDKKHAPFGFLKTAKNLRLRERGRLGTRKGFAPLAMTTRNGTLEAFDLIEFQGRACVLGSDGGDGYPTDRFEFVDNAVDRWRGTDALGQRVTVNPFSNPREVCGVLQVEDGVETLDAASGGGYTCLVFRPEDSGRCFVLIVDSETNQTVHQEDLVSAGGAFSVGGLGFVRVVYSAGAFYVAGEFPSTAIVRVARFAVGSSARFTTIVSDADSGSDNTAVSAFDLCAVSNPTTAAVVVAWDRGSATDLFVKAYAANGSQIGSTIQVASTSTVHLAVEADQTDGTINLYTVEGATTGRLRTFDFAAALLDGPTAVTSGTSGGIGRLPAQTGFTEHLVVAVNDASRNVVCQVVDLDAHTVTATVTVQNAVIRSRVLSGQSDNQDIAFAFAGLVAPVLPSFERATNALWFVTPDVAHMTTRDFVRAKDHSFVGLARDPTTLDVCWVSARDPGVASLGMPTVTLVDFQRATRRQTSAYGGLLYTAGATPSVYDGRIDGELGFQEAPGIHSLTAGSGGNLTPGATYYYTLHWEIVLADQSLMVSPVSVGGNAGEAISQQAAVVELGAGENRVTLVGTTPHSVRIALGDALFGADVIAVVSRTEWIRVDSAAFLLGTRDFGQDPAAAGNFSGLTLQISVDGGGTQTVTFGANDDAASELADAINAQTTGLTASVVGDAIHLESDSEGAAASISIVGGTSTAAGVGFIGFLPGDNAQGETVGSPGSTLRRAATKAIPIGMGNYGELITIVDDLSDDDLGDEEPIYTQADRGVLSGPLEQHAPRGCKFITATESRLLTGGLARPYEAQVSREAFLSEPFSFSEFSAFFAKASGPILGVESLDQVKILFTADMVMALPGEGPDDLGGGGLGAPIQVTSPGGLRANGHLSFLKVPEGLFYQATDDKLMILPRGAGSPVWAGEALARTLESFPTISGATRSRRDHAAVFALTSGTDGRLALLDFRVGEWFVDTVPLQSSSGIDAVIETSDGIAYLSGGVVYRQTNVFTDGASSPIATELETQPIYPFGVGGHGQVFDALFVGELEGARDLTLSYSLDDGMTYTALTTQSCTGSAGATIKKHWTLPIADCGSVTFKLTTSGALANGGIIFNDLTLLVEDQPGLELLPTSDYG